MKKKMEFREDGTFTILQFSDLHWTNDNESDMKSHDLMNDIINEQNPDFIIFTGDVIHVEDCPSPENSFIKATSAVINSGVPWAFVFGNHDAIIKETYLELLDIQEKLPNCLTERGLDNISGYGNYVLKIHSHNSDRTVAALYCMDSGTYAPEKIGGADWIKHDQINWFINESKSLLSEIGSVIPSLAFFHIPLPEYREIWNKNICFGSKYEKVGSAKLNSGLFNAFVGMNNIIGAFVGHDHINDYCGDLNGVKLCYGRATGYNTYGKEGFLRGARIIRMFEGERTFESFIRLDDGSIISKQQEHHPISE